MASALDPWTIAQQDESRRAADRQLRRREGAYYTPLPLARAIVARALEPLCAGRPISELAGLRVADPACGSGTLLLAAVEFLSERGLTPLEAARCCTGYDTDPLALEAAGQALCRRTGSSAGCALELRDPLLEPPEPRFDAIVANPPWEKISRADPRRERLQSLFAGIRQGEFNFNALFLSWAVRSLAGHGRLAVLTPSTWLVNRWDAKLRQTILGVRIEEIALLPAGTFAAAPATEPALLVAARAEPGGPIRVSAGDWRSTTDADIWRSRPNCEMSVYDDRAFAELWERAMERSRPLGEIAAVSDGIYASTARRLATDGPRSPLDRPVLLSGRELGRATALHAGAYLPQTLWSRHEAAQGRERLVLHAARNPKLRRRLQGAVLPAGVYVSNRFVNIRSGCDPWFLAAALLSEPINGLYARRFPVPDVDAFMLSQLPVPLMPDRQQKELAALARLHGHCMGAQIALLATASDPAGAATLARSAADLARRIDAAIAGALGLEPPEVARIRWRPARGPTQAREEARV